MPPTYRQVTKQASWLTRDSTTMLRLIGPNGIDQAKRPVVLLHGWPDQQTATQVLDAALKAPYLLLGQLIEAHKQGIDALLATGRVMYQPYTGASWGTATSSPDLGGDGIDCVDDCLTQAAADGVTATGVDLWGISMGGCNALNWAWRNEADVGAVFLQNPAIDLGDVYDKAPSAAGTSMRGVHGGADKTAWLPLAEDYDPSRQLTEMATIADRVKVFSARDDELVDWDQLEGWCDGLDIALVASAPDGEPGGGHLFAPNYEGWNDFLPVAWFDHNA